MNVRTNEWVTLFKGKMMYEAICHSTRGRQVGGTLLSIQLLKYRILKYKINFSLLHSFLHPGTNVINKVNNSLALLNGHGTMSSQSVCFISAQKLPKNMVDLGKLTFATGFEKLPKVQLIAQSGHTDSRALSHTENFQRYFRL